MDGDTRPQPSVEAKYDLLYRLMVIAAIAVIMVSLVGIASVTGLLSRVGDARPSSEMMPGKRGNDTERPNSTQPNDQQPTMLAVPAGTARNAVCVDCTGSVHRFTKSVLQIDLITNRS